MNNNKINVFIAAQNDNIAIGSLWFHHKGQRESASFEYEQSWLRHPECFALEPALQLTQGSFHSAEESKVFGAFGDSAPDRWGRMLMRRAESLNARLENRPTKTLTEIDYLLGVNDETRQGALRFSYPDESNHYLSPSSKSAIPPLIAIPKLLAACERWQDDESDEDLKLLLTPGSSLGGARPKASIRDKDKSLAIAKFPQKNDETNVVLWEAVALTLAKSAGIPVPKSRIIASNQQAILLLTRFDRHKGQRIPFLSAMSMLGAKNNDQRSYLEIAYAIEQEGASPTEDLRQLWRRIIFNIMISNTDDHLRNHGFLYEQSKGWRLSPAYDLNPVATGMQVPSLSTAISFEDASALLENAMAVSDYFRLTPAQANAIVKEASDAVKSWRDVAKQFGLSKRECDRMASAFRPE